MELFKKLQNSFKIKKCMRNSKFLDILSFKSKCNINFAMVRKWCSSRVYDDSVGWLVKFLLLFLFYFILDGWIDAMV